MQFGGITAAEGQYQATQALTKRSENPWNRWISGFGIEWKQQALAHGKVVGLLADNRDRFPLTAWAARTRQEKPGSASGFGVYYQVSGARKDNILIRNCNYEVCKSSLEGAISKSGLSLTLVSIDNVRHVEQHVENEKGFSTLSGRIRESAEEIILGGSHLIDGDNFEEFKYMVFNIVCSYATVYRAYMKASLSVCGDPFLFHAIACDRPEFRLSIPVRGRETEIESSRALGHANTVFWRANIKLGINNLYKRYEFYRSGVRNYFVSDKGKFFNMKEGIDMDWTIKFYQLLRDEVDGLYRRAPVNPKEERVGP